MLDAKKVKEMLTAEDIKKLFSEKLHAEGEYDESGNLHFSTELCHDGGDSPTKLVYLTERHQFWCLTHCHGDTDLFKIIQRNTEYKTFREAFEFVVNFFGLEDNEKDISSKDLTDDWDIFQRVEDITPAEEKEYHETILPERLLNLYSPACAPTEWMKDNINPDVMVYYGIRADAAHQRIIIPHRNIDGQLIGIRSRNFDPYELQYAKYAPVAINGKVCKFPTGKYLFGLYQNKETIRRLKKVLICEGEKSVLQASSYYGLDNCFCVATCGSNITDAQINLLLNLGVEEVILGYDRDYMGHKGDEDVRLYEDKLYRVIKPLLAYFSCSIVMDYDHLTGFKDSPTDQGREILEKLLKKKIYVPSIGIYDLEK